MTARGLFRSRGPRRVGSSSCVTRRMTRGIIDDSGQVPLWTTPPGGGQGARHSLDGGRGRAELSRERTASEMMLLCTELPLKRGGESLGTASV